MVDQVIDAEAPELDEAFFKRARPARDVMSAETQASFKPRGRPAKADAKQVVTLRLRPALLEAYQKGGSDWRARMEVALAAALSSAPYPASAVKRAKTPTKTERGSAFGPSRAAPGSRLKKR